jgi:hypothetical protein
MALRRKQRTGKLQTFDPADWVGPAERDEIGRLIATPDAWQALSGAGYVPYATVGNPPGGRLFWTVRATARSRWLHAREQAGFRGSPFYQ